MGSGAGFGEKEDDLKGTWFYTCMANIIYIKTLPVQIWKFFNPEIFADLGGGSVRETETSRVDGAFCGLFFGNKEHHRNRDRHVEYRV